MQAAAPGHDDNVIGAAALLVADRMRRAVEPLAGTSGASAAALTALLAWADGAHVDALAAGLRLSHSRAVRVVDALEREGLAVRGPDRDDGRRALVHLTKAGRVAAGRVLEARAAALSDVLASLNDDERRALAGAAEAILFEAADSRAEARAICRLCDAAACGHPAGDCPATAGADARERR